MRAALNAAQPAGRTWRADQVHPRQPGRDDGDDQAVAGGAGDVVAPGDDRDAEQVERRAGERVERGQLVDGDGAAGAVDGDLVQVGGAVGDRDLLGEAVPLQFGDDLGDEAAVGIEQGAVAEFEHGNVGDDAAGLVRQQEGVDAAADGQAGLSGLVVRPVSEQAVEERQAVAAGQLDHAPLGQVH